MATVNTATFTTVYMQPPSSSSPPSLVERLQEEIQILTLSNQSYRNSLQTITSQLEQSKKKISALEHDNTNLKVKLQRAFDTIVPQQKALTDSQNALKETQIIAKDQKSKLEKVIQELTISLANNILTIEESQNLTGVAMRNSLRYEEENRALQNEIQKLREQYAKAKSALYKESSKSRSEKESLHVQLTRSQQATIASESRIKEQGETIEKLRSEIFQSRRAFNHAIKKKNQQIDALHKNLGKAHTTLKNHEISTLCKSHDEALIKTQHELAHALQENRSLKQEIAQLKLIPFPSAGTVSNSATFSITPISPRPLIFANS